MMLRRCALFLSYDGSDENGLHDGWEPAHGFDPTPHNFRTSRTDDDPRGLFGSYNDDNGAFTGAGKTAWLRIPDEDGDVPEGHGEDDGYPYGPGGGGGGGGPEIFTMPRLSITFDGLAVSLAGTGEAADASNPAILRIRATDSLSARVKLTATGLENIVDLETGNAPVLPQGWITAPLDIAISCTGRVSGVVAVSGEMRSNVVSGGRDAPLADSASLYVLGEPHLVFDYDRDGKIDAADAAKARDGHTMFRFWVNDDEDDKSTYGKYAESPSVDIPGARTGWLEFDGRSPDWDDSKVNGYRDLIDFTPVFMDVSTIHMLPENIRNNLRFKLRHDSNAVNVVWTGISKALVGSFQRGITNNCGRNLKELSYKAKTEEVDSNGVDSSGHGRNGDANCQSSV